MTPANWHCVSDGHDFRIGLGVADIGTRSGENDAHALLDLYLELGGRLIDTARIYSAWVPGENHRSERILGDWLAARPGIRERLVLATKGCHPPLEDWSRRCHEPGDVRREIEGSLATLRVERIDLWLFHRDDLRVPVDELVDALAEHLASGQISAWGVSNWTADRIRAAITYARQRGIAPPCAVQNEWSLGSAHRRPWPPELRMVRMDNELMMLHRQNGLAALPYSAQANGFFSKWIEGSAAQKERAAHSAFATPANFALAEIVRQIAQRHGVSPNAVALAFLRAHPFPVVPLVGCHNALQLRTTWADAAFRLPAEDFQKLEDALVSARCSDSAS